MEMQRIGDLSLDAIVLAKQFYDFAQSSDRCALNFEVKHESLFIPFWEGAKVSSSVVWSGGRGWKASVSFVDGATQHPKRYRAWGQNFWSRIDYRLDWVYEMSHSANMTHFFPTEYVSCEVRALTVEFVYDSSRDYDEDCLMVKHNPLPEFIREEADLDLPYPLLLEADRFLSGLFRQDPQLNELLLVLERSERLDHRVKCFEAERDFPYHDVAWEYSTDPMSHQDWWLS